MIYFFLPPAALMSSLLTSIFAPQPNLIECNENQIGDDRRTTQIEVKMCRMDLNHLNTANFMKMDYANKSEDIEVV